MDGNRPVRSPRHLPALALILTVPAVLSACDEGKPDYPAALAEAEALFEARAFEEAYPLFDRLRRHYPGEQAPYLYLARTADRLGRPAEAIPALEERVATGGPGVHVYHHFLGTLLDKADRWDEAEHQYREALRLEAGFSPPYGNLSKLLVRTGRVSEALETARAGIARFPDSPGLRSWLGDTLRKLKRWPEAEHELRQAAALSGAGAQPRYTLGLVYLNTGRLEEARRELEAAVELRPDAADSWYQLANVCERLGDEEARDRALERFAAVFRQQLETERAKP